MKKRSSVVPWVKGTPVRSNPKRKKRSPILTYPQVAVLRDFKIATLFPSESRGQIQIVPAHYDTFSTEYICGSLQIGEAPKPFFRYHFSTTPSPQQCKKCLKEQCVCPLQEMTLILDTPVCRDGTVAERAKYTAPWPLMVSKSKIDIGKPGVFTRAHLKRQLLFGPYEAAYKSREKQLHNRASKGPSGYTNFLQLLDDFIDSSDPSLCNWLTLVATTHIKNLANCAPFFHKGTLFYKIVKPIPMETELLVWTGKEESTSVTPSNICKTESSSHTLDLQEVPLKCPWCNLMFSELTYLSDHKLRCSLAKTESLKPTKVETSLEESNPPLRRSRRTSVKSVCSYRIRGSSSSPSPPPSPSPSNLSERSWETNNATRITHNERSLSVKVSHSISESKDSFSEHERSLCPERKGLDCQEQEEYNDQFQNMDEDDIKVSKDFEDSKSRVWLSDSAPALVEKEYNYHLGNQVSVFDLPWVKALLMNKSMRQNKSIKQNNSNSLQCSSCHMTFYNHFGAALHEHSCREDRRPYKCGHCGKRFQLYFSIVKHMNRHKEVEEKNVYQWKIKKSNENGLALEGKSVTSPAPLLSGNENASEPESCAGNEQVDGTETIEIISLDSCDMFLKSEEELLDSSITIKEDGFDDAFYLSLFEDEKQIEISEVSDTNDNSHLPTSSLMTKIDLSDSIYGGRLRRHQCSICNQRFYRKKHIKKHMELHESETDKVFKCPSCNVWFGCPDMVKYHEETAHQDELPQIHLANLEDEQGFLKKLLTVLAKEGKKGRYSEYFNAKETIKNKKYECEICSKRFTSFYRVRKHKIVAHAELMDLLEIANELIIKNEQMKESNVLSMLAGIKEEPFMKGIQGQKMADFENNKTGQNMHDNNFHQDRSTSILDHNQEMPYGETNKNLSKRTHERPSKTTHLRIAKGFVPKTRAQSKLTSRGPEKVIPSTTHEIRQEAPQYQEKSNTSQPFQLGRPDDSLSGPNDKVSITPVKKVDLKRIIRETFTTNSSLEQVLKFKHRNQNEKAMRQCKVCGKKLSAKTNMKGHLRSHTGERHYECQYCHKRYALLSTLKRHIRIHTGYRPFKCIYCSRTYTQSSNLKRHHKQHTGERPFRCTFCPRKYAERFSLNRHLKKHQETKEHKCTICSKEFSDEFLLTQHTQANHNFSSNTRPAN